MTGESTTPPRIQWGLVILLGGLTAMGPVSIDMYLPTMPSIGSSIHASPSQTQATLAAFVAGMAVGQLVYGPASDRLGRGPPVLLGVAIYLLASVACAMAGSPGMLIGARLVQGLGACSGAVVSRAAVRDRFGHVETARMLSLLMLIMGLAPIFAPLVGSMLLAFGGWRLDFWAMATIGATLLTVSFLRMKETRSRETLEQAQGEHPFRSYLSLLTQKRLVGYMFAAACNSATLFTYISTSPDLLIRAYGIPPWAFGVVFGINGLGLIGSSQINRFLLRQRTPDQVLARASLIAIGLALVMTVFAVTGFGGRWAILPSLFSVLCSYGFIQGNAMAGALNVDYRRAGSISALMGSSQFGMGAATAAAAGLLHDGTAKPMALVMLAALTVGALVTHLLALPKGRADAQLA